MRSVNKVILIGNLTRDPESRQTPNGQTMCTFGIATNRDWITQESEKKSSTEFHEVVVWARLADFCQQYLKKGKLVYVEGYLKTRSWDTPEGVRRHKTEVVVQDLIILEKRQQGDKSALHDESTNSEPDDNMKSFGDSEEETNFSDSEDVSEEEKSE